MPDVALELAGIEAGYGGGLVLHGMSLELEKGTITCIVGPNGAGKSTVLRVISGLLKAASGSVSLPGETGTIPVTIANDLDVPVTVGLRVTGEPAVRLDAPPVAPVTIAPGRKASVEVTARVAGSGSVTAVLQLTTPSGEDYGPPARIEVGSAAYARAAAWVVGAAFALLLALVAVNTVRRVRVARAARRRTGPDGEGGDAGAADDGSMTP